MARVNAGEVWIYEIDGGQETVVVHDVQGELAQVSILGSIDEHEIVEVLTKNLTFEQ